MIERLRVPVVGEPAVGPLTKDSVVIAAIKKINELVDAENARQAACDPRPVDRPNMGIQREPNQQ